MHNTSEVRTRRFKGWEEVGAHLKSMNPHKAIEMYLKYHPTILPEFHKNELYAEPTLEQWSKVKVEKVDQQDFHRAQKAKKYAAKEAIERHEFDEEIGGI